MLQKLLEYIYCCRARIIKLVDGSAHALLFKIKRQKIQEVSIYGAGNIGQHLYMLLTYSDIKVISMFDKNAKKLNFMNSPVTVLSPSDIDGDVHRCIVIASDLYAKDITCELDKTGKGKIRVISLC